MDKEISEKIDKIIAQNTVIIEMNARILEQLSKPVFLVSPSDINIVADPAPPSHHRFFAAKNWEVNKPQPTDNHHQIKNNS